MSTKQGKSWTENADEIDRLRAQNATLLAALAEIADICAGPAATLAELAHEVRQIVRDAIARAGEQS